MSPVQRTLATVVVALGLLTASGAATAAPGDPVGAVADAVPAPGGPEATARVLATNPWVRTDPVGDATRPEGDLTRIMIENGRVAVRFTWRMATTPLWDTAMTDRATGMVFDIDWQGTTPPPNRTLVVLKDDGNWQAAILNGNGGVVCTRNGGPTPLPANGFRLSAPVQQCLGGARVLRVAAGFVDDQDDTEVDDATVDYAPQTRNYGPFIRLPNRSRTAEATTVGGWTVH